MSKLQQKILIWLSFAMIIVNVVSFAIMASSGNLDAGMLFRHVSGICAMVVAILIINDWND